MKQFNYSTFLVLFAFIACPCVALQGQQHHTTIARIDKFANDVQVREISTDAWTKPITASTLAIGSELTVKDSSFCFITFLDNSKLSLRSQTLVKFIEDIVTPSTTVRGLHVQEGRGSFVVAQSGSTLFLISSPLSRTIIRKAEGSFSLNPTNNQITLSITSGLAETWYLKDYSKLTVSAGQTVIIDNSGWTMK